MLCCIGRWRLSAYVPNILWTDIDRSLISFWSSLWIPLPFYLGFEVLIYIIHDILFKQTSYNIYSYVYYILRNMHAYRYIRKLYWLSSVKYNIMNSRAAINIIYTGLNYYIQVYDILFKLTSINMYSVHWHKYIKMHKPIPIMYLYDVYLPYTRIRCDVPAELVWSFILLSKQFIIIKTLNR